MGYLQQTNKMGPWKRRKLEKGVRGKQESGRSKGIIASPLERFICRSNRSYKHPEYDRIMSSLTGEKRLRKKKG